MMTGRIHQTALVLVEGDLTEQATAAIVNPANSGLILGGGVAGAIRRKGGQAIQDECNKIGGTPVGTAVITTGGALKAKHVIHAVGPQMGEGDEDRKLGEATLNSLKLADQHKLKSIAFPAISTGIFGYPIDRCAEVMLTAASEYLRGKTGLEKVVFCLWGEEAYRIFEETLKRMLEGKEA
jgi:O-acetyl-ADP-ribose deacetylase (regulator of RNase III)